MGVGGARAAAGRGRRGVPALNSGSRPPRRSRDVGKGIAAMRYLRGVARGASTEKSVYLPGACGHRAKKGGPGMANTNLAAARAAKNDEFYTQHHDIEAEMNAYLDYDADAFRGKTVLLPCDDPEWSSFTRYFAARFRALGVKRLISTSYAPGSKRYRGRGSPPSSRRAARASARRGRSCRGRSSPSTAMPTATGGSTSTTCSGTTSRGTATSAAGR